VVSYVESIISFTSTPGLGVLRLPGTVPRNNGREEVLRLQVLEPPPARCGCLLDVVLRGATVVRHVTGTARRIRQWRRRELLVRPHGAHSGSIDQLCFPVHPAIPPSLTTG
jgi:hypothetical protein